MKNLKFLEIEKIFMCSDVHGEFRHLITNIMYRSALKEEQDKEQEKQTEVEDDEPFIATNKILGLSLKKKQRKKPTLYNNSLIIVCGDCGFGFNKLAYYETTLKELDDWLVQINSTLIFFRGNHDDPSYFKEEKLKFQNIRLIDDYTVISTKEHNILCVGGGLSIDRSWRITRQTQINRFKVNESSFKKLFWEDENFVFNKEELQEIKDSGIEIDIVATHIAPNFKKISFSKSDVEYWLRCNQTLKRDIEVEKEKMKSLQCFIFKNFNIKAWFCGHLHTSNIFRNKDIIICQIQEENTVHDSYLNVDEVISSYCQEKETIFKHKPLIDWGNLPFTNIASIDPFSENDLATINDSLEEAPF